MSELVGCRLHPAGYIDNARHQRVLAGGGAALVVGSLGMGRCITLQFSASQSRRGFNPLRLCDHAVVDVVPRSREMYATHAGQADGPRAGAAFRLD